MLDRLTSLFLVLGILSLGQPIDARAAACTDEAAVAAARATIDTACPCPDGTDRRTHLRCVSDVTEAQVAAGTLPKSCAGGVKRCAKNSSCGKPGMAPCCTTNPAGGTTCKVTTPEKCTARGGCTGVVSSCCDACGAGGCVAPTTTSTLPPSLCGNGHIDDGEQCDGEAFCHPTACSIPFKSCCEVPHAAGVCSRVQDPQAPCFVHGPTAVTKLGQTSTGTTSCASGLFDYSEFTFEGACDSTIATFPPTSICCDFFALFGGPCTDATVSDAAALAQFQATCSHISMATVGFFAKVGTCSPGNVCVPTH